MLEVIKDRAHMYCEACTPPYSWKCRRKQERIHTCSDPAVMILRDNIKDIISQASYRNPMAYYEVCFVFHVYVSQFTNYLHTLYLQLENRILMSPKISKRALLHWCESAHDRERMLEDMHEQLTDWVMDNHPGAVHDTGDAGWNAENSDSDKESEGHDTVN